MKKDQLSPKIRRYKEKYDLYLRLEAMLKSKQIYQKYTLSKLHREIIKRFLKESSSKIAKELKINRSLIYAVIERCKDLTTIEELKRSEDFIPSESSNSE